MSGRPDAPLVTIGMPLYNNERTVRRAIESLLAQSMPTFRLIASDDGSRDDTARIVEEFAARDSRVEVVRQPHNLNYGNFRYLLGRAATPFFMFAAGDDVWHPEFIARCLEELELHPEAVLAVPQVQFVSDGNVVAMATGTYPLEGEAERNLATYLGAPSDNSRMYGVFRTEVARRAFPAGDHHAYDWTFSAATLREGTHRQVPSVLLVRDYTPPDRYIEYVRRDAPPGVARFFPLLRMTKSLLVEKRIPLSPLVLRALAAINLEHHSAYARTYHPRYHASVERLLDLVRSRL